MERKRRQHSINTLNETPAIRKRCYEKDQNRMKNIMNELIRIFGFPFGVLFFLASFQSNRHGRFFFVCAMLIVFEKGFQLSLNFYFLSFIKITAVEMCSRAKERKRTRKQQRKPYSFTLRLGKKKSK